MAFCANCGAKIEEGVRFCTGCGASVEAAQGTRQFSQGAQSTAAQAGANKNPLQYFTDAIKKYVVFNGRARRAEFWWFALFSGVISWLVGVIGDAMGIQPIVYWIDWSTPINFGNILGILANLFFFLPGLAVSIRRMHDVGKSGWYLLVPIYDIVLAVTAGNTGANQYGNDPKSE